MNAFSNFIKAIFDICFYGPFLLVFVVGMIVIPMKASQRTEEENRRAVAWLVGACIFWGGSAIVEAVKGALVLFIWLMPLGLLATGVAFIASPILSALMACRAIDTWEKIDRAADDLHDIAERDRRRY